MRRTMAASLVLACLARAALGQAGPAGKVQRVGPEGLKFAGSVDATARPVEVYRAVNPRRPLPLPARLFTVRLRGGQAYRLDLASAEIHAFLVVQDENGKQLTVDENIAGKADLQVTFTAPHDGNYKVFAATLRGAGKFTLAVRQETVAAVREVGTGLKLTDTLSDTTLKRLYPVKLVGGKTYVIDMVSPNTQVLDPYLRLLDATGKQLAFNDDIDIKTNLNSQIVYRAPVSGTYQIEASSYMNSGRGPYTLEVREKE